MKHSYKISNIFRIKEPYVLKYVGNFKELKEQLIIQKKLYKESHIEYFESINMQTSADYTEAFIKQMYFDKYIDGGCGRNYHALLDCVRYLNEPFEVVGLNYNKFVIVLKDCEYLYKKETKKTIIEGEYEVYSDSDDINYDIGLFNIAGEELSIPVTGTTYDRPAIPFHVIYHTTKKDFEFIKKITELVLK